MTQLSELQAFGKRLRQERRLLAVRDERDVEFQEIAEAVGADATTVGRWFKGESWPREEALTRLAAYLRVTKAWLRYGQEPRGAPAEIVTHSVAPYIETGVSGLERDAGKPLRRQTGAKKRRRGSA